MKIYIQIADGKRSYPVKASITKPKQPLKQGSGAREKFLPTVTFAIDVKFNHDIFKDSIKTITEFELTSEMIQSPAPEVNITQVDEDKTLQA